MKVLQICLKPPLPEIDGGCKAINNITQGLLQNNIEVKVLTLSTFKHPFKKEAYNHEYISQTNIESAYINTRVKLIPAFLNLFSSNSYNIERFYSKEFEELIVKTIQQNKFDVILLESLYVSKYLNAIKKNTTAKIIYRAHNIESEIWERNASQEQGIKKSYLNILVKRLRLYERNIINQFDGIAAITEKDKNNLKQMGCEVPIVVIPFGINIDDYIINNDSQKNSIFHIGSMDWKPNQNGIKWFLDNVWGKVAEKLPSIEFNLAGKDMPGWLINHQQDGVNVIGEVQSATDFINQNSIMVIPLFVASGMRIKIVEGMALGKLVIATSIAAEGITYEDKKNIVIANTKEEFVAAIINYSTNIEDQKRIAKKGRELIESNYDNQLIVNNLAEFFKQLN
ncbi:MAG: glycosyltransferase [Flavobacteriales bacterium]|nr:glycosyltransferase [Flavobacteriales bacterium]